MPYSLARSIDAGDFKDLATPASIGLALGLGIKAVSIEGFAHQHLAHNNLDVNPLASSVFRISSVLCGLSPNRFALKHRVHHRTNEVPAARSTMTALINTVSASGANNEIEASSPLASYWTENLDEDPLIDYKDNERMLKNDPWYERVSSGSTSRKLLGPLTLAVCSSAFLKGLGVSRPIRKGFSFAAGTTIAAAAQPATSVYAEEKAGISEGRINIDGLTGIFKKIASRHDIHHGLPGEIYAGMNPFDRRIIQSLIKLRIGFSLPKE